ncbi:UNVERIFIED_CONTAM: hypothetical protein GTU68_037948 [Idotea baltica]|nr:hypothetical protein [Idotea baltica]
MPKSFSDLGIINQLQKGLADLQISVPTDIQQKTIPVILQQKEDVVALAKTGTGKTAAFGLPLLQLINIEKTAIQAVILVPTRELGQQITSNLESFSVQLPSISIATICGGVPIKPQIERLKSTTHIVVATPGRLADLVERNAIDIKNISYLVLDEGIRDRIMGQFREGYIDILVATDLAARGIDVKEIEYVVNYHLPDTYDAYVHRSGRTARAGAKGLSLTVLQEEEVDDIALFEKALGISFNRLKKADAQSIEENNTLLWAKKIFKTKPNQTVSEDLKNQVSTIFHHLTKEELIDKVLANYIGQKKIGSPKEVTPKKNNR